MRLIINAYERPPGSCRICGGAHLPAIDTERDTDLYESPVEGAIYICVTCAAEIAGLLGWVSHDKYEFEKERADTLEQEVTVLDEARNRVEQDLAELQAALEVVDRNRPKRPAAKKAAAA